MFKWLFKKKKKKSKENGEVDMTKPRESKDPLNDTSVIEIAAKESEEELKKLQMEADTKYVRVCKKAENVVRKLQKK